MKAERAVERSVDTLQRVYAVIVALAINEALKRTFLSASGDLEFQLALLPQFLALIVTAVPFLHGMNRHLDQTLTLIRKEATRWMFIVLVIDFVFFLMESCVMFLLAASLKSGVHFFQLLMVLLVVDIVWSSITWQITKLVAIRWAFINLGTVAVNCIVIYGMCRCSDETKAWILASVAILRTILDYLLAWDFYFPPEAEEAPAVAAAPPAAPAI